MNYDINNMTYPTINGCIQSNYFVSKNIYNENTSYNNTVFMNTINSLTNEINVLKRMVMYKTPIYLELL